MTKESFHAWMADPKTGPKLDRALAEDAEYQRLQRKIEAAQQFAKAIALFFERTDPK